MTVINISSTSTYLDMRNVVVYVEQTAKYRIAKYRIANQGQLLDACMGSTHSSE